MESNTNNTTIAAPVADACVEPPRDIGEQPGAPDESPASYDKVKTPCSTTYGGAIYDTENESFWLLPERTTSALKEAANELDQKVSSTKTAEERKKGLYSTGLLEYFLEPKLGNFLVGEQQARMLEIEAQYPTISDLDATLLEAQQRRTAHAPSASTSTNLTRIEQDDIKKSEWMMAQQDATRVHGVHGEWLRLKRAAIAAAKEKGYAYESGSLYSPEAIAAREGVLRALR